MGSPFRPLLSILVYKEYRIYIVVSFLHIINGTVGAIYDNCVNRIERGNYIMFWIYYSRFIIKVKYILGFKFFLITGHFKYTNYKNTKIFLNLFISPNLIS